jgi:hypothetical protein
LPEVENQNYLGIYIGRNTATVVCLGSQAKDRGILGCFSVSTDQHEKPAPQALAALIAEGCAERQLKFTDSAVALDCAMFMQHNVSSEFSDPRQIAATVRFDTEEALATDIADVAVAFKISSTSQTGSKLTVFTAQRKVLSDILVALQSNNIDPVTIEPDVSCLSRFIGRSVPLPADLHPLFCVLSRSSGYFISFPQSQEAPTMRTFLLGPAQDRTELLTGQIPVTAALVDADQPIDCIKVFDSAGSVDCRRLGEGLDIEADSVDLAASVAAAPETLADCADAVDFAIAYGAALCYLEKIQTVNFRNDFSPYQGKKIRLQKTLKFLSISVAVFVLAVGLYFQVQLLQMNKYRGLLREKFEKQYSDVMFGKKPPPKTSPVKRLESELRHIRDIKEGQLSITGEEAIPAKLTLVLEAFNKCAAQTGLNIDSITITTRAITIVGDTSSKTSTLKLFETIKQSGLEILQQSFESKAGRDNFRITVEPKG